MKTAIWKLNLLDIVITYQREYRKLSFTRCIFWGLYFFKTSCFSILALITVFGYKDWWKRFLSWLVDCKLLPLSFGFIHVIWFAAISLFFLPIYLILFIPKINFSVLLISTTAHDLKQNSCQYHDRIFKLMLTILVGNLYLHYTSIW